MVFAKVNIEKFFFDEWNLQGKVVSVTHGYGIKLEASCSLAKSDPEILTVLSKRRDLYACCFGGLEAATAFNPSHPNINMHILHPVPYTFPKVLTRRICLPIIRFLPW